MPNCVFTFILDGSSQILAVKIFKVIAISYTVSTH